MNPHHIVCKRVLALPGDTVRIPVTSRADSLTVTVQPWPSPRFHCEPRLALVSPWCAPRNQAT